VLQRKQFNVAKEYFCSLGLEQDPSTGWERLGALVCQLPVGELPEVISSCHQFQQVRLAVPFFHLADRIAVSGHIVPWTLADAVDP